MTRFVYIYLAIAFLALTPRFAAAQNENPAGKWKGHFSKDGVRVEATFNVKPRTGATFSATMDLNIAGNSAFGLPASECTYDGAAKRLHLVFAAAGGLEFQGTQAGETLRGVIGALGEYDSLTLIRVETPATTIANTAYAIDSVTIKGKNARLAATVTHPWEKGKYPALVLVTGSGPQDRDETIFNHKPFEAIADHLTQQGIVVLRYDDRGVGGSTGDFATATTADFADDAAAAVRFARKLPYVDKDRVGVLGHSEGGIIAMMLAAEGKKEAPNFIVLMASPGVPMKTILVRQNEESMGPLLPEEKRAEFQRLTEAFFEDYAKSNGNRTADSTRIAQFVERSFALISPETENLLAQHGVTRESLIAQNLSAMTTPWFLYAIKLDPATYLTHISCSVLAMQGERDRQVLADENVAAIREGLSKTNSCRLTVKRYADLNHLFIPCRTGSVQEYPTLNAPFSAAALDDLAWWVKTR